MAESLTQTGIARKKKIKYGAGTLKLAESFSQQAIDGDRLVTLIQSGVEALEKMEWNVSNFSTPCRRKTTVSQGR